MNEEHPPISLSDFEPQPIESVFHFELLSDDEIIELNHGLTSLYVSHMGLGDVERDSHAAESVIEKMAVDLKRFARSNPDRAAQLLTRVAFNAAASSADLTLASDLAEGLFDEMPEVSFQGLLAAGYGDHWNDRDDGRKVAVESGDDSRIALVRLRDNGRLSPEQVSQLAQAKVAWERARSQ